MNLRVRFAPSPTGSLAWFNRQHLRRAPVERLLEELGVSATPLTRRAVDVEASSLLDELGRQLGLPKRAIMHALRVALTGREHGLPIASILYVLGGEETRRRLERAIGALPAAREAS